MSGTAGTSSNSGLKAGVSSGDTTICVTVFTEKKEDWESWKVKVTVKSGFRGYKDILTGETKAPKTHDVDSTKKTSLSAEEQFVAAANKTGYGDSILSSNCSAAVGKVAFKSIKGAKTKEILGGDLRVAFLCLKTKYEPSTTPQLMPLPRTFHSMNLHANQDPDAMITELEALKVQMGELDHDISDKSLILHILNNLTPEYEMEIKVLEHQIQCLKEEKKELSVDEAQNQLNVKFEHLKRTSKQTDHAFYMGTTFKV
jgi:gag-polypeptide of LTR copia-type